MKISIAKEIIENDTQKIDTLITLSIEESEKLENSLSKIELLSTVEDYFQILENNYFDFVNCVKDNSLDLLQNSLTPLILNEKIFQNFKIESNRKLLNYLSSFRTLIDHIPVILDKNQKKDFSNYLTYLFDNEFSYAFIYKLRNYSQHCGLPITNYESKFDISLAYIFLIMDVEILLLNYDSWGAVKERLSQYRKIDSVSIISENYEVIKKLLKFLFQMFKSDLENALIEIDKTINHIKGDYKLLLLYPQIKDDSTEIKYIPLEKIEKIKQLLSN